MTKKFLIFTLCLFILSTFISACGGGGKTTPPNSPFFPIPTPTPTPAKYSLELSQTEFTINIGETDNITVTLNGEDITQTATYTVDQEAIATVEAGLITGISVGIATVTVHAENAEADKTFTVNVIDPTLPNLEVNPTEVDLLIDEEGAVTVTLEGKDVTENVTYTVDDKSIATVEKGKITGIDEGTTNVKVSLTGANSALFKVHVKYNEVTLNDEVLAQLGYQKVKNTPYYDIKKIEDGTIVTNLEIPATFQDNENKKCKIIAIGNSAFEDCTSLQSVTIPDSVTHIGYSAFDDSTSLQSVTIGSGLTAIGQIFYNCSKLENVTVSDNVLCIFPKAFKGCTNLTQLTTKNGTKIDIPDSGVRKNNNVTFIDVKTTSTITSVTIPDGVIEIPDKAFWNNDLNYNSLTNITIPDSVTTIGNSAFNNCTSLQSVTIPDSVTHIGNDAFNNCSSLQSVTFGENSNLESIGDYAFNNCTSLESVTIPDSVTTIGNLAFNNCDSLQSVTIGSGLTAIGQIFYNCSNLENVTISDNVLCIFPEAFKGCTNLTQLTTKNGTKINIPDSGVRKNNNVTFIDVKTTSNNITSVTIPNGVTEIPYIAFWKYDSLTNITIPKSVTSIGQEAFKACSSLKNITIPDRVTTIGREAFLNCTSLTSVTFGENSKLESIGNYAFENCGYSNNTANLKLDIPDSVTSIGSNAFYNLAEITYDPTKMTATGSPWGAKKVNGVVQ